MTSRQRRITKSSRQVGIDTHVVNRSYRVTLQCFGAAVLLAVYHHFYLRFLTAQAPEPRACGAEQHMAFSLR